MTYKIGIVGLGVMGHNLALNMERNGFPVAGYDLDPARIRAFLEGPGAGKNIIGVDSPASLMDALEKPRRVLLMVPAGAPVDSAIAHLRPCLEPGDILMDGGNSFFMDTERRNKALEAEGFNFIGTGVSGGEQGALRGPYFSSPEQPRGVHSANKNPQTGVEYRGRKGTLYEGGLRVPFIARWPGKIAPGCVSDHLGYFPDVMPTIAEVTGAKAPADLYGISLVPELIGQSAPAARSTSTSICIGRSSAGQRSAKATGGP